MDHAILDVEDPVEDIERAVIVDDDDQGEADQIGRFYQHEAWETKRRA